MMNSDSFLGIFVNSVYVQNEGLQQVFDNLESAGRATRGEMDIALAPTDSRLSKTC